MGRKAMREIDTSGQPYSNRGQVCLLYTSDAADERSSVDLGGRRIIKKKKERTYYVPRLASKQQEHTNTTQQLWYTTQ